jgi:hypothetical protein
VLYDWDTTTDPPDFTAGDTLYEVINLSYTPFTSPATGVIASGTVITTYPGGVQTRYFVLDPIDMRHVAGYVTNKAILLGYNSDDAAEFKEIKEWLKLVLGWTAGSDQSLGHPASEDPQWEDDTNACPE